MRNAFLYLILIFILIGCKERQRKGAFQGTWYKDGFDMEAFTVRADSMYFPGLERGYFYELNKDTLSIQFTESQTKSKILGFSSEELTVWDMSLTKDTIVLKRTATPFIDTVPKRDFGYK